MPADKIENFTVQLNWGDAARRPSCKPPEYGCRSCALSKPAHFALSTSDELEVPARQIRLGHAA